jgi:DNA adenine methylase
MVRYYGSKNKFGNEISDVIINYLSKKNLKQSDFNGYIEPFCGALGLFKFIVEKSSFKKFYACDVNKDMILLFKELKKGNEIPLNFKISREEYDYLKESTPSPIRALGGIVYSYGGGWFNGYCPSSGTRNYVDEGYRSLNSMIPIIKKINFSVVRYQDLKGLKNFVIYCDPPYSETCQKYNSNSKFNSEEFWNTVRKWSKNNIVFISEISAPSDFKCIWSKEYTSKINKEGSKRVEKLFVYKGPNGH